MIKLCPRPRDKGIKTHGTVLKVLDYIIGETKKQLLELLKLGDL